MPTVLELAQQYRAALERQDTAALNRLIRAYGAVYRRLEAQIELLARDIAEGELTRGQVLRLARYKSLVGDIRRELIQFQGYLGTELDDAARAAIGRGASDALGLLNAAAEGAGLSAQFNRLPSRAIQQLLAFLDPSGPLYERIAKLAGSNADKVANTILELVGIGKGPRAIASAIRDALGGGLTDALRLTRTAQLYAYREANRANYLANADVVQGWVWYAELDDKTCPSCIAQHGSIHPLTETLNDHHNGRCAMIPLVGESPVAGTGKDWFESLSESQQKAILGPGRFEAFKAGKFEFGSLSAVRQDDVYGPMRVAASLKDLA